jgi:hypothetical protein
VVFNGFEPATTYHNRPRFTTALHIVSCLRYGMFVFVLLNMIYMWIQHKAVAHAYDIGPCIITSIAGTVIVIHSVPTTASPAASAATSVHPPPPHPSTPCPAVNLSPRISLAACAKSATPSIHLHIDEAAGMFSIYSNFLSIGLEN